MVHVVLKCKQLKYIEMMQQEAIYDMVKYQYQIWLLLGYLHFR